jgi:hypothetical protein
MMQQRSKQVLFILLSAADLVLTWWLLCRSGGQAYEANPIAAWWLARHGAVGLACFKAAAVLLVLVLAGLIARYRPRTAGCILTLACVSLTAVVLYSAALSRFALLSPEERAAWLEKDLAKQQDAMNSDTQGRLLRREALRALRKEICNDLLAGRATLRDAVARVIASEAGRDASWLSGLTPLDPEGSVPERVAVSLILEVFYQAKGPEAGWSAVLRLEQELQSTYGRVSLRHRERLPDRAPQSTTVPVMLPRPARPLPLPPATGV